MQNIINKFSFDVTYRGTTATVWQFLYILYLGEPIRLHKLRAFSNRNSEFEISITVNKFYILLNDCCYIRACA